MASCCTPRIFPFRQNTPAGSKHHLTQSSDVTKRECRRRGNLQALRCGTTNQTTRRPVPWITTYFGLTCFLSSFEAALLARFGGHAPITQLIRNRSFTTSFNGALQPNYRLIGPVVGMGGIPLCLFPAIGCVLKIGVAVHDLP